MLEFNKKGLPNLKLLAFQPERQWNMALMNKYELEYEQRCGII